MAPPEQGAIVFQRVTLRYMPQAEPVLAGASFAIQPGQVVAVTGAEGTGKSTLLLLIAGLYRPQGGLVRIDGHDVRSFNPAVLRRSIGWVPQSPGLLYGTVAQNLRLARPSASDAELRAAAAEAGVLETIEALPQGFDTRVGDNQSGRLPRSILQRIALAGALLRDAPILLLDEPVAGLDDACAKAFTDVIAAHRGRCTILMATHRPSHIRAGRPRAARAGRAGRGTRAAERSDRAASDQNTHRRPAGECRLRERRCRQQLESCLMSKTANPAATAKSCPHDRATDPAARQPRAASRQPCARPGGTARPRIGTRRRAGNRPARRSDPNLGGLDPCAGSGRQRRRDLAGGRAGARTASRRRHRRRSAGERR